MLDPQQLFARLDQLGIAHRTVEHPPVFTVEEAKALRGNLPGHHIKNLFLRNKKGDRHYLVVLEISKRADLKDLVKLVGDDRLSFGSPERLTAELGLTPGSVSPFGLLNDADGSVRVLVDHDLQGASRLIFHPNINTASVVVSWAGLEKFFATRTNPVRVITLRQD